jgi:hypothetical protein
MYHIPSSFLVVSELPHHIQLSALSKILKGGIQNTKQQASHQTSDKNIMGTTEKT